MQPFKRINNTLPLLALLAGLLVLSACDATPKRNAAADEASRQSVAAYLERNDAPVRAQDVSYAPGITGYLARPDAEGNFPGVVMIHEWWGLNDHIRDMAERLAAEGYTVLAVDMFDGKVAKTPDEARAQVSSLDQEKALENLKSAAAYLRNEEHATRVASFGWCFGGGQSLQLSLSDTPLDATIIYYGNLVTEPERLASIEWPVMGVFGDEDQSIPVSTVQSFDAALSANHTPHEIHIYRGVGHAFANPSNPNFAAEETQDAWAKTLDFLGRNLQEV